MEPADAVLRCDVVTLDAGLSSCFQFTACSCIGANRDRQPLSSMWWANAGVRHQASHPSSSRANGPPQLFHIIWLRWSMLTGVSFLRESRRQRSRAARG